MACCQRAGTWGNHACSTPVAGSHKARASTCPGLTSRCSRPGRCAALCSASPWRAALGREAWPCERCSALPARAAARTTPCATAAVQDARRKGARWRRHSGRRAPARSRGTRAGRRRRAPLPPPAAGGAKLSMRPRTPGAGAGRLRHSIMDSAACRTPAAPRVRTSEPAEHVLLHGMASNLHGSSSLRRLLPTSCS